MSTEILIIDDNADIRLILDELINDAGYEAVQRTTEYDLIEVTSKAI